MSAARTATGAIVTGAASGIGRAVALRLAANGGRVVAADRDALGVERTAADSCDLPGSIVPFEVDVTAEASVDALFDVARNLLEGPIGALANVAGVGSTDTARDTPLAVWEHVFAVNARGTFLCSRRAISEMAAAGGGGAIVNVASIAALVGLRRRAAYCAAKGAVVALTRAMAIDHVEQGIRVNCVCPGTIDTPWVRRLVEEQDESMTELTARQPMGRLGTAEEVAEAVAYLLDERAGFMTGSVLVLDGGLTAA